MTVKIPQKLLPWVEARKKHHLSHAQIQMPRELGMKPKSLDKLANCKQQPLYRKANNIILSVESTLLFFNLGLFRQ